jgi:hypothetical protein
LDSETANPLVVITVDALVVIVRRVIAIDQPLRDVTPVELFVFRVPKRSLTSLTLDVNNLVR